MKSNYLRKAYAHSSTNQVSISSIRMICFQNLYVTEIIMLNSSLVSGNTSRKSIVKIKKGTNKDFIDCKDL